MSNLYGAICRATGLRFTGRGFESWPGIIAYSGLWQATYAYVPLSPKQYNLVPAKGVISLAGKVAGGLVESNDSLPPS